MKIRVYLATTQGPVLIERISREPAPQSAICLKRTTKVLPVSAGYDAFVRQPSGVVEREFGPFDKGGFRLDVSDEIADGESWQLGVFVAHALKEAGELAGSDEPFDEVWWLTGEVDNDLNVQAVAHVPDKIRAATDDINSLVESNTPVTLFLAEQNLTAIDRSELPYGIRVVGVSTTAEVVDGVGHATPPPTLELKDQVMPTVPWPERTGGADRSGMGAARRSSAAAVIGASILTLAVVLLAVFGIDLFEQPPPPQPVVVAIAPPPPPPPSPVPDPPAAQPSGPQPGATASLGAKGESGSGVDNTPSNTAAGSTRAAVQPNATGTDNTATQTPAPTKIKPPDAALKLVAGLVEVNVSGLFPESDANCAAVHFGGAKTVRETIGLASANTLKTLPVDDLCAIEIEIAPRGDAVFVRALLDVQGGDFVERQRWPAVFSGAQRLAAPVRWRGDLPKRLLAPLRYRLLIAAAPANLSWLSDAMIRGSDAAGAGSAEFKRRGVDLIQRQHTIRPF